MKTENVGIVDADLAEYWNCIAVAIKYAYVPNEGVFTSFLSEVEQQIDNEKNVYGWFCKASNGPEFEIQYYYVINFPEEVVPVARKAMKGLMILIERDPRISPIDLHFFKKHLKITCNQIRSTIINEHFRSTFEDSQRH